MTICCEHGNISLDSLKSKHFIHESGNFGFSMILSPGQPYLYTYTVLQTNASEIQVFKPLLYKNKALSLQGGVEGD